MENMKLQPNIALSGCKIWKEFNGGIEVVQAAPAVRKFPARVNDALGICIKTGPSHSVMCEGRSLLYPADGICIRYPETVWSCETSMAGFVSVDIEPHLLPLKVAHNRMRFYSASELPITTNMILTLVHGTDTLQKEETYAEMISALASCGALHEELISTERNSTRKLMEAREFMIAHPQRLLTLDEIAKAANTNKYVLVRQFRKKFGITPHQFLLRIRVENARLLLTQGANSADAATAAGFSDQSHMNRHFRRIVGMTPHKYARQIRKAIAPPVSKQSILF
jgi:AraC-like DNA-binding protein